MTLRLSTAAQRGRLGGGQRRGGGDRVPRGAGVLQRQVRKELADQPTHFKQSRHLRSCCARDNLALNRLPSPLPCDPVQSAKHGNFFRPLCDVLKQVGEHAHSL